MGITYPRQCSCPCVSSPSIYKQDRMNLDDLSKIFPTVPGLDKELDAIGITLNNLDKDISGSMEFSEYYANFGKPQGDSGEITPISCGSEFDFNTNDATAGSSSSAPEYDLTVTEDIEKDDFVDNNETITCESFKPLQKVLKCAFLENNLGIYRNSVCPKIMSSLSSNVNVCTNDLTKMDLYNLKPVDNSVRAQCSSSSGTDGNKIDIGDLIKDFGIFEKDQSSANVNVSNATYLKWKTNKEKFMDKSLESKTDNIDFGKNLNTGRTKNIEKDNELLTKLTPGATVVKESYIEPPKIGRVSKSYHGKSAATGSYIYATNTIRRASDSESLTGKMSKESQNESKFKDGNEIFRSKPQFMTQRSQPCDDSFRITNSFRKTSLTEGVSRNARFTTTRVDEAEHAASVGLPWIPSTIVNSQVEENKRNDEEENE